LEGTCVQTQRRGKQPAAISMADAQNGGEAMRSRVIEVVQRNVRNELLARDGVAASQHSQ
jgi:hypothetical protein